MPDKDFCRFPGGCPSIGKGNKRPKYPPSGHIYFPLNALVEDNPLRRVPYTGSKTPVTPPGFRYLIIAEIIPSKFVNVFTVIRNADCPAYTLFIPCPLNNEQFLITHC
jgi:hypothetical protein